MDSGFITWMRREPWQYFVTLTFKDPMPGERNRFAMLYAWLRAVCELRGLERFEDLLFIIRPENGEITDRPHFHVLLTGMSPRGVCIAACFMLKHAWEKPTANGGMARVYVYNPDLAGVEYMFEGPNTLDKGKRGSLAQTYELGKFARVEASTGLIPAHSLMRKWRKMVEPNRRHRKAHEMRTHKCDHSARGAVKSWGPHRFLHPADPRVSPIGK